jgi:hypothetical protein
VKFSDGTFADEVTLAGSTFEGRSDFDGVVFEQAPDLTGTTGAPTIAVGAPE